MAILRYPLGPLAVIAATCTAAAEAPNRLAAPACCDTAFDDVARYTCANSSAAEVQSYTEYLELERTRLSPSDHGGARPSPRLLVLHVATANTLSYAAAAAALNAVWADRFGHHGVLALRTEERGDEVCDGARSRC